MADSRSGVCTPSWKWIKSDNSKKIQELLSPLSSKDEVIAEDLDGSGMRFRAALVSDAENIQLVYETTGAKSITISTFSYQQKEQLSSSIRPESDVDSNSDFPPPLTENHKKDFALFFKLIAQATESGDQLLVPAPQNFRLKRARQLQTGKEPVELSKDDFPSYLVINALGEFSLANVDPEKTQITTHEESISIHDEISLGDLKDSVRDARELNNLEVFLGESTQGKRILLPVLSDSTGMKAKLIWGKSISDSEVQIFVLDYALE